MARVIWEIKPRLESAPNVSSAVAAAISDFPRVSHVVIGHFMDGCIEGGL